MSTQHKICTKLWSSSVQISMLRWARISPSHFRAHTNKRSTRSSPHSRHTRSLCTEALILPWKPILHKVHVFRFFELLFYHHTRIQLPRNRQLFHTSFPRWLAPECLSEYPPNPRKEGLKHQWKKFLQWSRRIVALHSVNSVIMEYKSCLHTSFPHWLDHGSCVVTIPRCFCSWTADKSERDVARVFSCYLFQHLTQTGLFLQRAPFSVPSLVMHKVQFLSTLDTFGEHCRLAVISSWKCVSSGACQFKCHLFILQFAHMHEQFSPPPTLSVIFGFWQFLSCVLWMLRL